MALLAGTNYDPAAVVSKATTAAAAMAALDTTNLRLTFTAPANGRVMVRMRGTTHGATTWPQVLLGVMSGSTVVARMAPIGAPPGNASASSHLPVEALFTVGGLTPGQSYTWDAAYGVETSVASTGIKYGGPNNATVNDAHGGFVFEVWEAPTLLATLLYDPAAAVSKSTAGLLAMTAFDTANIRHTFTVPASGNVLVRLNGTIHGATNFPMPLFGVLEGSTVRGRQAPIGGLLGTGLATTMVTREAMFVVTGLTPGANLTWDAAYEVESISTSTAVKYGGPNDTTANNAFGGFLYEIWQA